MPEHQQTQQSKKTNTIFQNQATPVVQTPASNPYSIIQRAKINPRSLTRADIMQLHRTIGNQAVGRLLSSIGSSSTTQQAPVQRQEKPEEEKCPSCMQRQEIPEEEEPLQGKMTETLQRQEIPEEEEPLQGKMIETVQRQEIPEEEPLQGKFENKPEIACSSCFASPIVQRQEIPEEEEPLQGKFETVQRQEIPEEEEPLQTKRENNTGMPDNLKAGVENLSGIDMSDVRVHYNSSKPSDVGALAYTQGTSIHVAPGQEKHLPHEAWHVVQQTHGRVRPTMQLKHGVPVNDDEGLEHEADVMGAKAAGNAEQSQGVPDEQEGVKREFAPVQRARPEQEELHIKKSQVATTQSDIVNVFYHPNMASMQVQLHSTDAPVQLQRQKLAISSQRVKLFRHHQEKPGFAQEQETAPAAIQSSSSPVVQREVSYGDYKGALVDGKDDWLAESKKILGKNIDSFPEFWKFNSRKGLTVHLDVKNKTPEYFRELATLFGDSQNVKLNAEQLDKIFPHVLFTESKTTLSYLKSGQELAFTDMQRTAEEQKVTPLKQAKLTEVINESKKHIEQVLELLNGLMTGKPSPETTTLKEKLSDLLNLHEEAGEEKLKSGIRVLSLIFTRMANRLSEDVIKVSTMDRDSTLMKPNTLGYSGPVDFASSWKISKDDKIVTHWLKWLHNSKEDFGGSIALRVDASQVSRSEYHLKLVSTFIHELSHAAASTIDFAYADSEAYPKLGYLYRLANADTIAKISMELVAPALAPPEALAVHEQEKQSEQIPTEKLVELIRAKIESKCDDETLKLEVTNLLKQEHYSWTDVQSYFSDTRLPLAML